ncbi:MAG: lysophospholipid acyltransferase family protein [Actinomycetota bacterium]
MTSPLGHIVRHVATGRALKEARSDLRAVARGWRWGRRALVPRSAEPFAPQRTSEAFRTAWARTPVAQVAREGIQRLALGPLLRHEVTPTVHGLDVLDRLPAPVIFVANHTSHVDTPLILCSLPHVWRRRTAVAAAADYFFDTWWRAAGSAMVFNTFPIERRTGSMSSTPGELLDGGWNVVVYPEGTRSPDGWARPFRHGAAFLAIRHRVPVIPVALRGSFAAMPRGRAWPIPGRPPVTVRFGMPLRPVEGEGPRELGARIEAAVAELLDEDASTWWEARRRSIGAQTPSPTGPSVAPWRRVWAQTASPAVRTRRRVWR